MRHVVEHELVLAGQEVAAQLQDHGSGDGHDDTGNYGTGESPVAEGNEVLNHFFTGGKSCTY